MSTRARQRIFILAASTTVVLLVALAILFAPSPEHRASPARPPARQTIYTAPVKTVTPSTPSTEAPATQLRNVDPEAHNPRLRGEHRRFLAARPLEQHLPYRDREIGVQLVDVTKTGKLVLLVTYLHSRTAAREDMQALLARYHDPATEYAIRYRPVFK
jgi:hypothetical protein